MKRKIALLLVLCLMLCACGKKEPAPTTAPTTEPTTAPTTEPTTEPTTAPTEPPVLYRHPLTGAPLEQPWSGQAVAVVINNLKKAMPQKGVSQADIFYEVEVEGDITRCLAIFTDLSKVGDIGPVRSARTAFNSLAVSYGAPLVHCGGSPGLALAGRYDDSYDKIDNWEHIDQAYNGKYFYRDSDRLNSGYAYEHTLFTTGQMLQQVVDAKGYNTPDVDNFGLQFTPGVELKGENAEEITVTFKSKKKTVLTYDAAKGVYNVNMHGTEYIDGNTNEPITFKNVIVLYTKQWYYTNGMHKIYDTIGSGEGYAAINGKIVPITWNREGLRTNYTYALADGTPLELDVGSSYIALVGIMHDIAYK